jgi:hypothetical protein
MFQTNTYIKIRTSDLNRPQKICKKTEKKQNYINNKISDYNLKEITQYDYVKCLSFRNKPNKI